MSKGYSNNPIGSENIAKHLLPLTPEEQSLLDFYGEVRALEKLAAKAASDAAKARLAAADEEYHRKHSKEHEDDAELINEASGAIETSNVTKKKGKKRKKSSVAGKFDGGSKNDEGEMSGEESEEYSDDGDNEEKKRQLELKLNALRDDVEEGLKEEQKHEATVKQQEDHREALLSSSSNVFEGPSLRKKAIDTYEDEDPSKLISLIDHTSTPPHDFSKSLKMNRISGTQLFPDAGAMTPTLSESTWTPPEDSHAPDEGCLELELPGFDPNEAAEGNGNNTLAVKFHAPKDAKRFSINIAAPDHDNYYSVLFHFNPRQFEKGGQVVINDKQSGIWGQGINIPLSTFPLIFGETSTTLIVQINGDGFDVFVNDQHCARLEHRVPLPNDSGPLVLQFPSTDDYGRTENWSVYKVWWGNKEIMASENISHVAGVNIHSSLHDKKLFISGLPKLYTEPELELRRAELERAFRKYGSALGVTVICPPKCSFAFIEVESYRAADMAIREMSSKYKVNRARRSRHEALMEKRAAAEAAAGKSETKESSDW